MTIAFWGSSLVSAFWNGAATYYRGILRALARQGHRITFYEPDAFDRQSNRDMPDPDWARIIVYPPNDLNAVSEHLGVAAQSDVLVKASGVGVLDEWLESAVARVEGAVKVFWDVDAPATLERLATGNDPLLRLLPHYDLVLTYGGGSRVTQEYVERGARRCTAIYNAFDPDVHFRMTAVPEWQADLSFLANRLPDRETRVDEFFLRAASAAENRCFLLGGSGWENKPMPKNVRYVGHVFTRDHNALNSSALAVLNVSRDSMARYGFSPATRVFEAAGAGACIISDDWAGMDHFLQPGKEILVADDGAAVASILQSLTPERSRAIGEAARHRVLREHTYLQRGALVHSLLTEAVELAAYQQARLTGSRVTL